MHTHMHTHMLAHLASEDHSHTFATFCLKCHSTAKANALAHKGSNCFFIFSVTDCDEWLTVTRYAYMYVCVCPSLYVYFHHYLVHRILSTVFNWEIADGLCFISRFVCGPSSGIPQSPLICCQIFINVTELRPPNDASRVCKGPSYNESVGSMSCMTLKMNSAYGDLFYTYSTRWTEVCLIQISFLF